MAGCRRCPRDRAGVSEVCGVGAGFGVQELETIGNGADGTAAFVSDLQDGQVAQTVEAENGEKAGRFAATVGVEAVEHLEDGSGDVRIGQRLRLMS